MNTTQIEELNMHMGKQKENRIVISNMTKNLKYIVYLV